MDQISRRQQQPRSNSISGHDFHITNGYSRPNKELGRYIGSSVCVDGGQHYFDQQSLQAYQQATQNANLNRSTSPSSTSDRLIGAANHNGFAPERPRSQLHASLECLNKIHMSEYNPQQQQILSAGHHGRYQSAHFIQQYQQQQFRNQHYAASYVLTAAPAETLVNASADQDLAAAAMGNPHHQQQQQQQFIPASQQTSNLSHNVYLAQSLINRSIASPLRRPNFNNSSGTTSVAPGNILSQLTKANNQSMRTGYSSLSLASSTFLIEDKLQNEIKKLQCELKSEKEKNEALNSQLNINSNLMAAFEQSLTTLNSRLRQVISSNENKEHEIAQLKDQLERLKSDQPSSVKSDQGTSPIGENNIHNQHIECSSRAVSPINDALTKLDQTNSDRESELSLLRIIDDLKRQLIEKDRLLTDTRLEALSAAHQLEQLESKLNGEHSLLANEDEPDEGVMVINHSPSDSEAITDSTHLSDFNRANNSENNINEDFSLLKCNASQNVSVCGSSTSNNSADEMNDAPNRLPTQHWLHDDQSNLSSSNYITGERLSSHSVVGLPTPEQLRENPLNTLLDKVVIKN